MRAKVTSFAVEPGRLVYQGQVVVDETPTAQWLTGDDHGVICFEQGDIVVRAALLRRAVVELTAFYKGQSSYTRVCPCAETRCLAERIKVDGREVAFLFIELEREPVSVAHFIPPAFGLVPAVGNLVQAPPGYRPDEIIG